MYDTENPVPRLEGRHKRRSNTFKNIGVGLGGLGLGYGGLKLGRVAGRVGSTLSKTEKTIDRISNVTKRGAVLKNAVEKFWQGKLRSQTFQSRNQILEFATLDYLRKYLVDEPWLARKGEPGHDPSVHAEVEAAALHRPRLTPRQEKMIAAQEGKKWRPSTGATTGKFFKKGYKTAPAGKDVLADVEGNVPGTSAQSIKQGVFKQMKDLTLDPVKPEPLPPEMLKGAGGKVPFDPDVVMKGGHPHVPKLWDTREAAKPTEVKITPNLTPRQRPRIPRNEGERAALRQKVSAGAEAFRDPIASHLARVKHGLTPDLRETYKEHIPGVPAHRLNTVRAATEAHRAQGIRDVLAEKGWAYRKNLLNPLRAYSRQQRGLKPIAPLGKDVWKRLIPELRFELKLKPEINIGGTKFQPAALRNLQRQFEKDLNKRLTHHKSQAEKIRKDIHARVGQSTLPLEKGREIEEAAMDKVKKHFDAGRTDPIHPLDAHQISAFTGYKKEEVEDLHKAFRRHSYLGETQAGEDELRREIFPKSLRKVPADLPKPPPPARILAGAPLIKRTGIGLGAAAAVGAGAYLTHKLRQRRRALQQMSSRARLIRFQQVLDPYSPPTPWHKKEARRWLLYPESRSRALEKTIGRGQRIYRDIRAPKTATGMVIGDRGRERQPEWQKPWFKRTLITGGIVGAALGGRHIWGKLKKTEAVAAGLSEKHLPLTATQRAAVNITTGNWARALGKKFPKTSSFLTSASTKAGGFGQHFKTEVKSLKEAGAARFNKAVEGEVGEVGQGKLIRGKGPKNKGVITKVEWDNPAIIKENVERARKIQAKAEQLKASGVAKEQRAMLAGKTRRSLEEALRKHDPTKKLNALLSDIINFQYPVPVREHTRRPRSTQPRSKQKQLREGLLLGAGGTAALGGTYLGTRWGYNRWTQRLSKEEAAKAATEEVDQLIKKRESEILGSPLKKVARAGKKIIPHKFKSRQEEIQFNVWSNLRQKISGDHEDGPSPYHDIAIGAVEGGLAFPASEYAYKKLIGKGVPSLGKKIAVGGAVGGLATGAVGLGLGALLRKRQEVKRRRQQFRSRLKEIRFQSPQRKANQRMLVAKDRYIKQIKERDIDLANKHYVHSALIGAGLGAVVTKNPRKLAKAIAVGSGIGVGVQKATRIYGAQTRDPFGERTLTAKRVERAPGIAGIAGLGYLGLKRLKAFSSRAKPIHFQEPQRRRHNVAAGLAVAAAGIPLYRGAGKFARIGLRGRSHGSQVADYLEASQHILNQGVTGKLAGAALRNPKHPIVKKLIGMAPHGMELGTAKRGLRSDVVEHYSAFRSSPRSALDSWAKETIAEHAHRDPKVAKELAGHYDRLKAHLDVLSYEGHNEQEAIRKAATHPLHEKLFRRMVAYKAEPTKNYQKISAGLAAVPATAGVAVAATTRKSDRRVRQ